MAFTDKNTMETDLQNIIKVQEGSDIGLIAYAVKITDGAPVDGLAGYKYLATVFNSFNGQTYINTGTNEVSAWTRSKSKDVVTQDTDINTAVEINTICGVITTVTTAIVSDDIEEFTVNNNKVKSDSVINLTVEYATSETGTPIARIISITDGSFVVAISNVHPADTTNAVVKIHFNID